MLWIEVTGEHVRVAISTLPVANYPRLRPLASLCFFPQPTPCANARQPIRSCKIRTHLTIVSRWRSALNMPT